MAMLPSPLIPDARQWIDAYDTGFNRGEGIRKRNVLLEAGQLAAGSGVPTAVQPSPAAQGQVGSVVDRIIGAESGGRVNATNPRSSATGAGQFISSTWLATLKKRRPDLAAGKSDAELLQLRLDPALSREMTQAYADENAQALRQGGFEVTPGTTYLSHFAGPAGARSVLSANPSAPVSQVLSPAAVRANPFLQGMTAGDLRAWADRKMGGVAAPAPVADPNAGLRNASNALLRGGELQAGLGIQNQLYERSEKARAQAEAKQKEGLAIIGELALRADTPEKWARAIDVARRGGLQVDGLEDFAMRELVLARAGKGSSGDEYGLNPIQGVDAQGNPVLFQPRKSGGVRQIEFPQNVTPTKPLDFRDTGTGYQGINRITNQPQSFIPKDVAGEAEQKKVGESRGEAQADLPRQTDNANAALQTIEAIRAHPGRGFGTGSTGVLPGVPGTQQRDFIALVDQAKGKAFLEAFNSLKGGGAITEIEGVKATDAIARLDRTQSETGFLKALNDLEAIIRTGLERAQKKAGGAGAELADAPKQRLRFNPETGELE